MRVTIRDGDTDITLEPVVPGPKVVLYDHLERPLKRQIGFDNRPAQDVKSHSPKEGKRHAT